MGVGGRGSAGSVLGGGLSCGILMPKVRWMLLSPRGTRFDGRGLGGLGFDEIGFGGVDFGGEASGTHAGHLAG